MSISYPLMAIVDNEFCSIINGFFGLAFLFHTHFLEHCQTLFYAISIPPTNLYQAEGVAAGDVMK
jgi:hypothetical protein